jgi:hypothetical protein
VLPGAGERALVAGLFLSLQCPPDFRRRTACIDRNGRLLFGEQDPVAILFQELAPRPIDVVSERDQDISQVLASPGSRPSGNRTLAYCQAIVRHHGLFGHLVDPPDSVAFWASTFDRVRRERFSVEERLASRVVPCPRIQHPQQVRERGDAADRGSRRRRSPLLLKRHRGRQAVDCIDLRDRHLVEQAPRIRRDRLQVAALRLGVQRPERQR